MATAHEKTAHKEKTFTLDGRFLRDEAREAVKSYFSPFAAVYGAATGRKIVLVLDNDEDEGSKAA
jgi:hypothetical protein